MRANVEPHKFHDGPGHTNKDVHLNYKYYTYPTALGLLSAGVLSAMFTIDRPAKDVWPYLKDFNLWQNSHGYYYSGVVGDLEGKSFSLSIGKQDAAPTRYYDVVRVIPRHLIVVSEPIPADGSSGGVSPGFHALVLSEFEGRTVVTYEGEHATRTQSKTEDEALTRWREGASRVIPIWRDGFIPALKKLVYDGTKHGQTR